MLLPASPLPPPLSISDRQDCMEGFQPVAHQPISPASHQDGSPDIKYVAEPLGVDWGGWSGVATTISMILEISCQLRDRQTGWSEVE